MRFANVCSYLENLDKIVSHDPPFLLTERRTKLYYAHATWFASHRNIIDLLDDKDSSALLSTFLPHRRKDRIYGLQSPSLLKLLGRCLSLSASARQDLAKYKLPGNGDLGECLQRLLETGGPPALPPVSIQEVDHLLHVLASTNRFSAPSVQKSFRTSDSSDQVLKTIMLRLHPSEAKWFVRLVLKDFSPVFLDDHLILRSFHFLLPDLLHMQDDFDIACAALRGNFCTYPSQPERQCLDILRQTAASSIRPMPFVKVSRPEYSKARSIKHCLQMTAGRTWLVERKYDGEYCQIHVDLSRGEDWLRIYSKSGRDSTEDRAGLRDTIRRCLRIGTTTCKFQRHCILVGEMVVFNDIQNSVTAFDNIRNHVSRAGVFIGPENNSPPCDGDHLMIILFDLLLLDDQPVIALPVEKRKEMLSKVYKKIHGRAAPAESRIMDFADTKTESRLMNHFAASIAGRHEGLVLKPCGVAYIPTASDGPAGIKLKKDYIQGLGDEADFAVLGASFCAQEANKRPSLRLQYTHFHLGCLTNKPELLQHGAKPLFKIVATIAYDQCISPEILQWLNEHGRLLAQPVEANSVFFEIETASEVRMDCHFRDPVVFEVLGSSYCKSNGPHYMLRHPRVKKLHQDRTWQDCITFEELQKAATEALHTPEVSETQENLDWISKLERSHKRRIARSSLNTTPRVSLANTTPKSSCHSLPTSSPGSRASNSRLYTSSAGTRPALTTTGEPFGNENVPLPTPPDSSPLVRQVLKDQARLSKRSMEDATIAPPKRVRCLEACPRQKSSSKLNKCQTLQRTPLGEIQNCATDASMLSSSKKRQEEAEGEQPLYQELLLSTPIDVCLLSESAIHVYGALGENKKRVIRRMLDHGALLVEDVQHWKRDDCFGEQLTDMVSESQAYTGLHKLVLVDAQQQGQLQACSKQLDELQLRGLVKIMDFRMMEALCSAEACRGSNRTIPDLT